MSSSSLASLMTGQRNCRAGATFLIAAMAERETPSYRAFHSTGVPTHCHTRDKTMRRSHRACRRSDVQREGRRTKQPPWLGSRSIAALERPASPDHFTTKLGSQVMIFGNIMHSARPVA